MSKLIGCALMPHLMAMVPEVGNSEFESVTQTVQAVEQVVQRLKRYSPQTAVIITPHGPVLDDAAAISLHPRLRGNLSQFGSAETTLAFETDGLLARHIIKKCERLGINLVALTDDVAKNQRINLELDYGAMVPLYYMHKAGFKGQIVHLSTGLLAYEEMYTFGKAVQSAIAITDKRVVVIASANLSRQMAGGDGDHKGMEYDERILDALRSVDTKALLQIDCALGEQLGVCGLRPILFLMGVLGGHKVEANILSYEAPLGVGCCVADFTDK